jgi:hypothetical protein
MNTVFADTSLLVRIVHPCSFFLPTPEFSFAIHSKLQKIQQSTAQENVQHPLPLQCDLPCEVMPDR